jgi:hypothetical protein
MLRAQMRLAAALMLLLAAPARADDAQAVPEDARRGPHARELPAAPWFEADTWPRRLIWRPLVLDCGMIEARLATTVGDEVAIAPALAFGVNRRLTVGVSHPDRGLCPGCDRAYDDVAVDARFHLRGAERELELAGRFGMAARRLSPATVALELGAIARLRVRDLAMVMTPSLSIGMTRRDLENRERFTIPVTLQWQATGWLAFELGGGLAGPVEGLSDALEVPAHAAVIVSPRHDLDLGFSGDLPDAFTTDAAEATAWLAWRH